MKKMRWNKLLSTKRVSELKECKQEFKKSQYKDLRNPFERDCDQIIYSYPFRRLQDKTQVIPFPVFDFVHTRLTHSLEVATVGRSLGNLAGGFLKKKGELPKKIESHFLGDLVSAGCLAHDIGNPPFGHSGEDSISNYFIAEENIISLMIENENTGKIYTDEKEEAKDNKIFLESNELLLRVKKWIDLKRFEGNANGFRILTNCFEKGINPTLAFLGVFTKYPRESYFKGELQGGKRPKGERKSQEKYGFFQSEREVFKNVAKELGLIEFNGRDKINYGWLRHPLTFLMEAADDICYQMIDFEDGCRLNLINYYEPLKISIKIKGKNVFTHQRYAINLTLPKHFENF